MDVSCHMLGGPQLDRGLVTTVINHVVVVLSRARTHDVRNLKIDVQIPALLPVCSVTLDRLLNLSELQVPQIKVITLNTIK